MKRILTSLVAITLLAGIVQADDYQRIKAGFANPPQEARTRVWWHWEDGNITKDGIRKDLEWMQRAGIGGFHHFDAGMKQAPVVEHRMIYMHDDWKDAFRYAISMADSLGMTVGIASSPGWSNTGGPWVKQDDAMKMLVFSDTDFQGGTSVCTKLPVPRYKHGYYRDIMVLAFPLPQCDSLVRAVKVYGNNTRQHWNVIPYSYNAALEASMDGVHYCEVARIPETNADSITVNVPPTAAKFFRLSYAEKSRIRGWRMFYRSRVHHAEEKAGYSTPYDLAAFSTQISDNEQFTPSEKVVDISSLMASDGTLTWDVPAGGQWRVIRIGYTLTGKQNGPAPKEATGLEVDKFDKQAYRNYFIKYLDMYKDVVGDLMGDRGIQELLIDSYEAKFQTWTPGIVSRFESLRGYSPLKWLPVLSGEILDSPQASEKFLFDWRRTLADMYYENYAQVKDIAAQYGIRQICLESQENGRVFVADGMDIKRHATVPMAACWTLVPFPTHHSTFEVAVADMRESASVAHLYGRQWVAAESFTADGLEGNALSFTPERLKRLADTEFASGVNRIFVHESSHQPLDDCRPGVGLIKYGQWFCRHETWAEMAKAWTDYLSRTSYMLSRGGNVADVLVYYGEDTNITARYGRDVFPIPHGLNYDFVNPRGLFDLKVEDGRVVAPSGASYNLLCLDCEGLPQSEEVAARLGQLKAAGANICSLASLREKTSAFLPDVEAPSAIRFVHRTADDLDIYWLNNPTGEKLECTVTLRACGRRPMLWNPVDGSIESVSYSVKGGRTEVKLHFNADDAYFIVLGPEKAKRSFTAAAKPSCDKVGAELEQWTLEFPATATNPSGRTLSVDNLKDYASFEFEDVKYFSGTCLYTTSFNLDKVPSRACLDLGKVCDLCQISVNGRDLGIVWRAPFALDVTSALRRGRNDVEIKVVNSWVNRLIGDAQPSCPKVSTYTTMPFYKASSPLESAGLIGPVKLNIR